MLRITNKKFRSDLEVGLWDTMYVNRQLNYVSSNLNFLLGSSHGPGSMRLRHVVFVEQLIDKLQVQ